MGGRARGAVIAGAASAVVFAGSASSAAINLGTATPPAWLVTIVGTGNRTWWTIAGLTVFGMGLAVATWRLAKEPVTEPAPPAPAVQAQRQDQAQAQAQQQSVHVHVHAAEPPVVARVGQAVVGEIPAQPPSFVDREQVDLLRTVVRDGAGVAVVCALAGGRGVGKTQIAAAYARERVRDGCPVVAWVSGQALATLLIDLAAVAERLDVADPDGDSEKSARLLRDALQSRTEPALLVVDNATDPAALAPFLPLGAGRCTVVITSTDRRFADLGTLIEVPTYQPAQSVAYLRARTQLGDDDGALAVAEELGHLPVALAQVPAVIRDRHYTYAEYLTDLRGVDLDAVLPRGGGPYPHSAAQALILAITSAETGDGTGLTSRLLRNIALVAPEGIDHSLLHALTATSHPCTASEVRQRLGDLTSTSLLTWAADQASTITAHRLTTRVLRERAHHTHTLATDASALVTALDELLPAVDDAWATRHQTAELVPHITAIWANVVHAHHTAPTPDLPLDSAARLMNRAVRHLRATADLSTAVRHGTTLLTDSVRVLGPDHPTTLTSRNNLADAYQTAGRLTEAIPLYEQNLAEAKRVLATGHPWLTVFARNFDLARASSTT